MMLKHPNIMKIMKSSLFAFLVFGLITFSLPGIVYAQDENKLVRDRDGNTFAPGLTHIQALEIVDQWIHPKRRNLIIDFMVNYPSQTGDDSLDRRLQADAEKTKDAIIAKFGDAKHERFCNKDPETYCYAQYENTFSVYAPSKDFLSIVFAEDWTGPDDDEAWSVVKAINYSLRDHRDLTIADVFTDPKASAPLLWAKVAAGWCSHPGNRKERFPKFYRVPKENTVCSNPSSIKAPKGLSSPKTALEALGNAFLTAEGMGFWVPEYPSFDPAATRSELYIPKSELIAIGARPEIWGAPSLP
jgi:hypothetical protein